MRKRAQNIPIRRKLELLVAGTSALALFLASLGLILYARFVFLNILQRETASLAEVTGANSASAILFLDPDAATRTLSALARADSVLYAAIYTKDGQRFAEYRSPQLGNRFTPPTDLPKDRRVEGRYVEIYRPIEWDGETLGGIYIRSSTKKVYGRILRYSFIPGAVMVAAFVFAIVLASNLQKRISEPLVELARLAEEEDGGVTDAEALGGSRNELEILIDRVHKWLNQIRESRAELEGVLSTVGEGIVVIAPDGTITMVNEEVCSLTGYTQDELVGADVGRFLSPQSRSEFVNGLRTYVEERGSALLNRWIQFEGRRKDGTTFPIETIARASMTNERLRFIAAVRDITDRVRNETALREAKEEAERASKAKSQFLSRMSHELRTPMNSILGFAQLLKMSPGLTETHLRQIDQILKAGNHLLSLIDEVLDLARVESGRMSFSIESVAVGPLISEALTIIGPMAEKRRITIHDDASHLDHVYVTADQTRLRQVMLNLLSNAVKYNNDGGSISVDCDEGPDDTIRIHVCDTGSGIAPEDLDKLFEPFNRLKADDSIEGTGIGLPISRLLVQAMGGQLEVESAIGEGTCFTVVLQKAPRPELDVVEQEIDFDEGTSISSDQRTVLYIEDNPANLELVRNIVAMRPSIELLTAADPAKGIELARAHRPDLILLDINLPGMDGFEVLARLMRYDETESIPVVALSANALPHDVQRGLDAGFKRYISKPVQVYELLDVLDEFLEGAKQ